MAKWSNAATRHIGKRAEDVFSKPIEFVDAEIAGCDVSGDSDQLRQSPDDALSVFVGMVAVSMADGRMSVTEKVAMRQVGRLLRFSDRDIEEMIASEGGSASWGDVTIPGKAVSPRSRPFLGPIRDIDVRNNVCVPISTFSTCGSTHLLHRCAR